MQNVFAALRAYRRFHRAEAIRGGIVDEHDRVGGVQEPVMARRVVALGVRSVEFQKLDLRGGLVLIDDADLESPRLEETAETHLRSDRIAVRIHVRHEDVQLGAREEARGTPRVLRARSRAGPVKRREANVLRSSFGEPEREFRADLAAQSRGDPDRNRAGRNLESPRERRPPPPRARPARPGSRKENRSHADHGLVVDRAAVDHGAVPDGDAMAHDRRAAVVHVNDGQVLDVRLVADRDRLEVPSQDAAEPHGGGRPQRHRDR